ncbi:hypothetical protein, partial [Enterobacter hormaechei]
MFIFFFFCFFVVFFFFYILLCLNFCSLFFFSDGVFLEFEVFLDIKGVVFKKKTPGGAYPYRGLKENTKPEPVCWVFFVWPGWRGGGGRGAAPQPAPDL